MWVYIQTGTDPDLWTVGFYAPDNAWHADRDFSSQEEAAQRVAYLNGGGRSPYPPQRGR